MTISIIVISLVNILMVFLIARNRRKSISLEERIVNLELYKYGIENPAKFERGFEFKCNGGTVVVINSFINTLKQRVYGLQSKDSMKWDYTMTESGILQIIGEQYISNPIKK